MQGATQIEYGYDGTNNLYYFPMPSNMHTHFRHPDDPRFPIAVETAAKLYHHATAMPNLGKKDLIRTPERALAYREAIETCGRRFNGHFTVNVPLYLEPDTKPETVFNGCAEGAWIAAKLYPKGGTTQSDEGVDFRNLKDLYPVFGVMQECDMKLLIHAEPLYDESGNVIDPFEREQAALPYLEGILRTFPKLSVVFEHISTASGAKFVRFRKQERCAIEATVAPQYLVWSRGKLFAGGMNPAWYSIPVLKKEWDRRELIEFILDGHGFLGTDSAPHLVSAKSRPCGCSGGVFNEPVGLYTYFRIFEEEGPKRGIDNWLERFVEFACVRGPTFYGLPVPRDSVLLAKEPWAVPERYGEGENAIIPMLAGETVPYRLKAS